MSMHVVHLEDDEALSVLVRRELEQSDIITTSFSSVDSLLDSPAILNADLFILDYTLNGPDTGIDVFRRLRERGVYSPAILATGLENPDIVVEAIRAGLRDFIPKDDNFLFELLHAVLRVKRNYSLEQQAVESERLIWKQQVIETAMNAATMCCCRFNEDSEELKWTGPCVQVFGLDAEEMPTRLSSLLELVHQSDRTELKSAFVSVELGGDMFATNFRLFENKAIWINAKSKVFAPQASQKQETTVIVFQDVTEYRSAELELAKANIQARALNDRLKLGLIESNHRIKNSLQNIVSLLNLSTRKNSQFGEEEIKKLSSHIHGLATLHDIMVHNAEEDEDYRAVDVEPVLEKVADVLIKTRRDVQFKCNIDSLKLPVKQVSSLTIIVNELLSNALKHGDNSIDFNLISTKNGFELTIVNEGSQFPDNFFDKMNARHGLSVVNSLSKADFGCTPEYLNKSPNEAMVRLNAILLDSH